MTLIIFLEMGLGERGVDMFEMCIGVCRYMLTVISRSNCQQHSFALNQGSKYHLSARPNPVKFSTGK